MHSGDSSRNILITGAAGGFGSALAVACAHGGARVLLVDRDERGLEAVCDRVTEIGGPEPGYCRLDLEVANPATCTELMNEFVATYGELHALVHGAARFGGLRPMEQVPGDDWLRSMQVNVNAVWLMTAVCLPSLKSRRGSLVVVMLDDPARSRTAYWGAYGVGQAARRALVEILSEELDGTRCRVVGVEPGPMRTALRSAAYLAENPQAVPPPEHAARHVARLLLGEVEPEGVIMRVPPPG